MTVEARGAGAARGASGVDAVRVRVLGEFAVDGVALSAFGSRKVRQFLKVLALGRGRPVGVDRLIECLWGDRPPARPADQLAVLASRARRQLGTERIVRSGAGYALLADWLDLDELELLAVEAADRLRAGSPAAARAAAGAALRLARGDLLADEPDAPWADADRAAAARLIGEVLARAAEAELAGGDPAAAATLAAAALDRDPYDEVALRSCMRAHVAAGRPASALSAYAAARDRLRDDLGVSPTAETEALHTSILLAEGGDGPSVGGSPRPRPAGERAPVSHRPLVGREQVLAALDAIVPGTGRRRPRLVVIEGESGIGKTAVLDAWLARVGPDGPPVLRGACDELSRQLPFQAVIDAIDAHLANGTAERATRVLGADAVILAPLLGGLPTELSVGVPGSAEARPAGRSVAWAGAGGDLGRPYAALVRVLHRVADGGGAILVLDDLQFAGPSTMEWLRYLQRRSRDDLLVVVATRPDPSVVLAPDDRIVLEPLDLAAARALVGPERAADLLARSGGHPLFLMELAQAGGGGLPESVRASVADRCRQLGAPAATLTTAAVLGPEIDLDLLAGVLERSAVSVLDDLERGEQHRFLDEVGATLRFRHELVREALQADISSARRSLIHRQAARVLAARSAGDPRQVAHHALLGGEVTVAAASLAEAATEAAFRFDRAEAVRLLDRSIALDDRAEWRIQRGRELMALWRYEEAADDAEAALSAGAAGAAYELGGWAAYYRRDFDRALSMARRGVEVADDPLVESSCRLLTGRVLQADGRLPEADEHLSRAFDQIDRRALPVASIWLASLRTQQSRAEEALALMGQAEVDHVSNPFALAQLWLNRAHALGTLGRADDALEALTRLDEAIARQQVADRYHDRALNWRSWVLRHVGEMDEADELNRRSVEATAREDLPEPQAHALLDLAESRLLCGDPASASDLLVRAARFDQGRHANFWRHALRNQLSRSRVRLAGGDPDEAEALASMVVAEGHRLGLERYHVLGRLVLGRVRLGRGDLPEDDELDQVTARLPVVAGLEAWWWLAEWADSADRAAAPGSSALARRLRSEAVRQATVLRRSAGAHAPRLDAAVAARLPSR